MNTTTKRRLLIICLLCVVLTCMVALCFTSNFSVNANGATVNVVEDYVVLEAAQVRTEEPSGIRFITEIPDQTKSGFGEDAEFGVIIIPETLLGGQELTHSTANHFEIPVGVWIENYKDINTNQLKEGYSAFNSVLSSVNGSLPESLYNVPLAVRAYVKHGENNAQVSYSENTIARSIAYVSKMALINGYDSELVETIAENAKMEIAIENAPQSFVYGDTANYGLTLKVGGVPVVESDKVEVSFETLTNGVIALDNGTFSVAGAGTTTVKVTVTSKTYEEEGNSFTFEKEITVNKKAVNLTDKVLFDKYVAQGAYTVDVGTIEGDLESVTFADVNNAENIVTTTELSVDETVLATGYYNLTVETNNAVYTASAVVADKVINNKDELKNWPYYIRPANWANNIALEYDGLIVLGNDIDWGGRQIGSDGKETNKYVNELAAKANTETSFYIGQSANSVTEWTNKSDYVQIATGYKPDFVGTFDGLGHNISNLFLAHNGLGLFGTYCSGTIKNLSFTGLYITGYRKGAICFDFTGTAEDIFLEGTLLSSNLRTGLLAGYCSSTPMIKCVSAILSEGPNRTDAGIIIGAAIISNTSSEILGNIYGIGNIGLLVYIQGNTILDAADKCFMTGKAETLDAFVSAEYNIYSFSSEYWNTESGFPIMKSAIGRLTKINLQATDETSTVVTEVSAGASLNIGIANYKTGDYTNNQAGFSTVTVNDIDGVTYENGVLTVASTVAVGTEIVLTVTNNLDGSTNTLKLTVK